MATSSREIANPIEVLEDCFLEGRSSIVSAAFSHSYFVHPDAVRQKAPYFPDRARRSLEHYSRLRKGAKTTWPGDGRQVKLDDNQHAQMAWEKYTGRKLFRSSGYGVRHVWGHPWNPDCFTAGWNLCYMPFWAGMLTESQHPHPELERAIRQASWELYFRNNPVCQPLGFVEDPGFDLGSLLAGQPLLILVKEDATVTKGNGAAMHNPSNATGDIVELVKAIRAQKHQSWSNIRKAARSLQGLEYEPFGTLNVERSAKSCVKKMHADTGLSLAQIETLIDGQGW